MSDKPGSGPAVVRVIIEAVGLWWDNTYQFTLINLLWALSWLTVVLGPPATFGLYYAAHRVARQEAATVVSLWEGMKRYFVKSWAWMLLNLLVVFIVWLNVGFYAQFGGAWWATLLQTVFAAFGVGWILVQFLALPFVMELKDERLRTALRNSAFVFIASPGYVMVLMAVIVALLGASIALVGPMLFVAASLVALLGTMAVRERLAHFRDSAQKPPSSA
jgi:uncharacterized membrane protein YesL